MKCSRGICTTRGRDAGRMWTIVAAGLVLALLYATCGRQAGPGTSEEEQAMFGYRIEKVGEGQELVVLTRGGENSSEARIAVWAGANLESFSYRGVELIRRPDLLAAFNGQRLGTPILYPTPCRVPDGYFTYLGREFHFPINREDTHIHGLVRDIPWSCDTPLADSSEVSVTLRMEFAPGSQIYGYFPLEHTLELTYTLDIDGLRVAYKILNRDSTPLPYGFGLHPYWSIGGSRDDLFLRVLADSVMTMGELIPAGGLMAVAGTHLDLREPTPMSQVEMDDVFFPADPASPATMEWRTAGVKLTLTHSPEFTHVIVYAPPGEDFVCVENMTAAPNAHNLFAAGHERVSGLKVVPPGGEAGGWVKYTIRDL